MQKKKRTKPTFQYKIIKNAEVTGKGTLTF